MKYIVHIEKSRSFEFDSSQYTESEAVEIALDLFDVATDFDIYVEKEG